MGKKKKRATAKEADHEWNAKKCKVEKSSSQVCIIHTSTCKSFNFTPINTDSFKRLQKIRNDRQRWPVGSALRMENECQLLTDYENTDNQDGKSYGYHRGCYQNFTKNLDRLKCDAQKIDTAQIEIRSTRSSLPSGGKLDDILFQPDCIFCNIEEPKRHYENGREWHEKTILFTFDGGKHVQDVAVRKNDEKLLLRIRDIDLFAARARFHESCRKVYTRKHTVNNENKKHQEKLQDAHNKAFDAVKDQVISEVIEQMKVLKLSDMRERYVEALSETEFANQNYRAEKLKAKLEKHPYLGDKLSFTGYSNTDSTGKFKSQLIFNNTIDVETAIKCAYELGTIDRTKEIALTLRTSILEAHKNVEEMPWPPTADYLKNNADVAPQYLRSFLRIVFTGKEKCDDKKDDFKIKRLILSVGQDICRAATNGMWSLPKHVLMCMTLRHMFRSKELITLINRFGHCENYYFGLELETAIAKSVQLSSSYLSPEIIRNPNGKFIFHSEFDNYDSFISDIFGSGIVNTAHGIMLQEIDSDQSSAVPIRNDSIPKTKERSYHCEEPVLPDVYVSHRKSPSLKTAKATYLGSAEAFEEAMLRNMLWIYLRTLSSSIPAWGGFISSTGRVPKQLTIIGYYPVVYKPITEYSTVVECLKQAEEATKEVGQKYTVTTFDLGVCMKAYPLIFNNPLKYKHHIILIGTFHLMCAYFKMIGKKMKSSGLADIMYEAALVKSGTVKGVMNGKNYSRSIACHKVVIESLEKIILDIYLEKEGTMFESLPETSKLKLNQLIETPSEAILQDTIKDFHIKKFLQSYIAFKDRIRKGELGKTAMFWVSYSDHVWLVLRLYEAVKRNDFLLYAHCIHLMPGLFFSYDGQNYARYLTMFSIMLANIDESHPGAVEMLKQGAFSVARSFIPGSRGDVDKTMEETFMKQSKSNGGASGAGITGIQRNYDAYQRWVRTTHERSKYLNATYALAGLSQDHQKTHKDLRKGNIRKSHSLVRQTISAIDSFLNPFKVDDGKLYCLSSGVPVPLDVEIDLLRAETVGVNAKNDFIKNRLEKSKDFYLPIKRKKLKTMASLHKVASVTTSQKKEIQYKDQGNILAKLLVKSLNGGNLDLNRIMKYCLTPVPYCIATADGYLVKGDKSKSFSNITKETENVHLSDAKVLNVEDGNALFYQLKPLPDTFKKIAEKIFESVGKGDALVSTDMYKEESVKRKERERRECGERLIVSGENTKKPANWKGFLSNSDNKIQLINLIHRIWSSTEFHHRVKDRKFIMVKDGKAFDLSSVDKSAIPSIESNQEETDSRIVLYAMYAASQGYDYVRIKTPDSDIFWILLHHSRSIGVDVLYDTGFGNKRRLINISQIAKHFTQTVCTALLGIFGFTGMDSASFFKGKGKIRPMKYVLKSTSFCSTFAKLGESWDIPEDLVREIERFVCVMYAGAKTKFREVDDLRAFLLKSKCEEKYSFSTINNIDFATFPPSKACLVEHVRRVNYQVRIWKLANVPIYDLPCPSNGHGWLANGEPCWCPPEWILPPSFADILEEHENENDSEREEDESDSESEECDGSSSDSDSNSDSDSD